MTGRGYVGTSGGVIVAWRGVWRCRRGILAVIAGDGKRADGGGAIVSCTMAAQLRREDQQHYKGEYGERNSIR